MMTDSIADMLTRIRNAYGARKERVEIPFSKMKQTIAEILLREGYIQEVNTVETPPQLILTLKYQGKRPAVQSIQRESTPGHRQYCKKDELPNVLNGYGIMIVSTSRGIMTNKEARKLGIGGEIICSVY